MNEQHRSTQAASSSWPLVWRNMPDPQSEPYVQHDLHAPSSAWRHIVAKHISGGEPGWREFACNVELLESSTHDISTVDDNQLRTMVVPLAQVLEQHARLAMSHPLMLAYTRYRHGSRPSRRWIVVLPFGTMMILGMERQRYVLITCFVPFLRRRFATPIARRHAVLMRQAAKYGVFSQDGLIPPPATGHQHDVHDGDTVREVRRDFRFLSLCNWGFDTELRGSPWRGAIPEWPDADALISTPVQKNRLNRRRNKGDQK